MHVIVGTGHGVLAADCCAAEHNLCIVCTEQSCINLLCAPCFAAMGAIKREMNNGKWTAIAIGYMCALAYCAALVVYQIGGLITGEVGFNFFTIVAIVIFAAFLYLMFRPNKYVGDNEVKIDVSKIK